jgi:hypothetical protein
MMCAGALGRASRHSSACRTTFNAGSGPSRCEGADWLMCEVTALIATSFQNSADSSVSDRSNLHHRNNLSKIDIVILLHGAGATERPPRNAKTVGQIDACRQCYIADARRPHGDEPEFGATYITALADFAIIFLSKGACAAPRVKRRFQQASFRDCHALKEWKQR